jgi:tetratricopeptide (TPR) repeat protein
MSLNNLANRLSDLGRREEALEKAQEAVRIREQLAKARPDAFLPDLATSCGARGEVLRGMERYVEAAASFAQGIRVITPLFQKTPTAFAQLTGMLVSLYRRAIQDAKLEPETKLLAQVMEVFTKPKQDQTKERS